MSPDLDLLSRVLALTDPRDVRVGSVATGLDMWSAATLKQAGLRGVRPNFVEPSYSGSLLDNTLPMFESIDKALLGLLALESRFNLVIRERSQLRRAIQQLIVQLRRVRNEAGRSTSSVLGESRRKQVDVFIARWDRGLELLVSTKTFALAANINELVKNLPNRWEEFDGDLKNLRGRFPLAVIGALTVLPAMATQGALPASVDMMTKLTAPGRPWVNAYDRATIIIADWEHATPEFVPIVNSDLSESQLPIELQPFQFFDILFSRLFERAPVNEHREARMLAARARGQDVDAIAASAAAVEQAETKMEQSQTS